MLKIAFTKKVRHLIFSPHFISGNIILVIALLLVADIYSGIDLLASQIKQDSPTTKGIVTGYRYWGQGLDNDDYFRISYSYKNPYGEDIYFWTSYSKTPIENGKEVTVVYVKDQPTVSKIKGMTNTVISQMEITITPFILLLALITIFVGVSKQMKPFWIIKNSVITIATLYKARNGNLGTVDEFRANFTTEKNKKVKKLVYCYRLKDTAMPKKELVVYHKNRQKQFFLVEDLPSFLKEDIQQQIDEQSPELVVQIT